VKILVTAGPTREFLDDVRFLSNPSSGKMGFEVALAAADAGHEAVLVSGPAALPDPPGVEVVRVISAEEMAEACLSRFPDCDAVIMTAAVCDYRAKERLKGKLKKKAQTLNLELTPTTDILAEMGKRKAKQVLVGFALEVSAARINAVSKLAAKNLDYIVLNSPDSFAEDRMSCEIIDRHGRGKHRERISKRNLARELIKLLEKKGRGTS
jgi:phosphopantothenoylcysteine decarboxylase/phosphopantothenate--cysteine ligase